MTGQIPSTSSAASTSVPSEGLGATFFAAIATPKWPMNIPDFPTPAIAGARKAGLEPATRRRRTRTLPGGSLGQFAAKGESLRRLVPAERVGAIRAELVFRAARSGLEHDTREDFLAVL